MPDRLKVVAWLSAVVPLTARPLAPPVIVSVEPVIVRLLMPCQLLLLLMPIWLVVLGDPRLLVPATVML